MTSRQFVMFDEQGNVLMRVVGRITRVIANGDGTYLMTVQQHGDEHLLPHIYDLDSEGDG